MISKQLLTCSSRIGGFSTPHPGVKAAEPSLNDPRAVSNAKYMLVHHLPMKASPPFTCVVPKREGKGVNRGTKGNCVFQKRKPLEVKHCKLQCQLEIARPTVITILTEKLQDRQPALQPGCNSGETIATGCNTRSKFQLSGCSGDDCAND